MHFDTLDYAKRLEEAGVPASQAEAQAKLLGEALSKSIVSPGDLGAMEDRLSSRIASVETRIEAVRTELKLDLGGRIETLKWMFGVLVALNAAILIRMLYLQ